MTGQAVVHTNETTPERTAGWQPMTGLRSSSLPALEEKVRREEDMWSQLSGRRLLLGERLRWAEANRARGRAEG